MSSIEALRVSVEQSGGGFRIYTLKSKVIELRGGKTQTIRFFVPDAPSTEGSQPVEYEPQETLRMHLPLAGQVDVARAIVDILGEPAEVAAAITGRLKGQAEGLSPEETENVINEIRAALDET